MDGSSSTTRPSPKAKEPTSEGPVGPENPTPEADQINVEELTINDESSTDVLDQYPETSPIPGSAGTIYIPPAGLRFRIFNPHTNTVLVSSQPVSNWTSNQTFADQWWTIVVINATQGLYAFRSTLNNSTNVLTSRTGTTADQAVTTQTVTVGYQPRHTFRLVAGTNSLNSHLFRLVSQDGDTSIYSRTSSRPLVGNVASNVIRYDDQFFTLTFAPTRISRIVYHIERGTIISAVPLLIGTSEQRNNTSRDQSITFSFTRSETTTQTFERSHGFTVAVGTTASVGLPFFASGEIRMDASTTHEFSWGSAITEFHEIKAEFPAIAAPYTRVVGTATITRAVIDVPFTLYNVTETGQEVATFGNFRGVSLYHITKELDEYPLSRR